jgi:hypothetical protein
MNDALIDANICFVREIEKNRRQHKENQERMRYEIGKYGYTITKEYDKCNKKLIKYIKEDHYE